MSKPQADFLVNRLKILKGESSSSSSRSASLKDYKSLFLNLLASPLSIRRNAWLHSFSSATQEFDKFGFIWSANMQPRKAFERFEWKRFGCRATTVGQSGGSGQESPYCWTELNRIFVSSRNFPLKDRLRPAIKQSCSTKKWLMNFRIWKRLWADWLVSVRYSYFKV